MTYRPATYYDLCLICLQRGHCSASCGIWKQKGIAQ